MSVRAARERRGDSPRDLGCSPALGNARPQASIPASPQDLPELTGELQAPVLMGAGRHGMETDPHVQWLLHTGLWAEAGKCLTYERKGGLGARGAWWGMSTGGIEPLLARCPALVISLGWTKGKKQRLELDTQVSTSLPATTSPTHKQS